MVNGQNERKIKHLLIYSLLLCVMIMTVHVPAYAAQNTDNSRIEDFVTRFYVYILDRQPDESGLAAWSQNLRTGKEAGANVGYGFVQSPEFLQRNLDNESYVRILYKAFFDREADSEGLSGWLSVLQDGLSRLHVYKGFAESKEFSELCEKYGITRGNVNLSAPMDQNENVTRFVVRCYRLCLSRDADGDGLNAWCSQILNKKNTAKEVAYGFVFSTEFKNKNLSDEDYVKTLYHLFMDRDADAGGLAAWVKVLKDGAGREHVFNGFADSKEFKDIAATIDGISGGNSSGTSSGELSPLHVQGTQLVDASGNQVVLKGISTHGLAWFPQYVNEECFKQLHDEWHVNVIRLAMYTAEYGGYCSGGNQTSLKQLIKDGVNEARDAGMYAIVDWHILSDGNPNTHVNDAKNFFTEMSSEFSDYTNVIYEICNEPNGGTSWSDIKAYAQQVIPVIRANDPDAVILVGTPTWSQDVDVVANDPIRGYDDIMYTLHFYAATHTDWIRNKLTVAVNAGLPIFVSEFGICDASGNGSIDYYQAKQWMRLLDEYGISRVAWNLSNKNETSSILKYNCQKTSGFTINDLSDSGKWVVEMIQ